MNDKKNETKAICLTVTEGLTVTILPDPNHEFLMLTKEVAVGYGTTKYSIQKAFLRNSAELIEGKHFMTARTFCPHDTNLPHNAVLWTKRGIVRLGFFIKSDRAKLFRDWAEELVIASLNPSQGGTLKASPSGRLEGLPQKRVINRLDRNRMVRLLAMAARIDDAPLRNELVNELMAGFDYGQKGGQA